MFVRVLLALCLILMLSGCVTPAQASDQRPEIFFEYRGIRIYKKRDLLTKTTCYITFEYSEIDEKYRSTECISTK